MSASESITRVRDRVELQRARVEQRAAPLKPVDFGARIAAIRSLAAAHGVVAPPRRAAHIH